MDLQIVEVETGWEVQRRTRYHFHVDIETVAYTLTHEGAVAALRLLQGICVTK